MTDCVFCKIVNWETPSQRVYEDDKLIAFLDINPINSGHTLIIPRAHYTNVLDTPAEVWTEMMRLTQKVGAAAMKAMGSDGFNIGVNTGRAAGQLVDHVHVHVIPRLLNDGLKSWPSRNRYAEGQMGETAKKIRAVLQA